VVKHLMLMLLTLVLMSNRECQQQSCAIRCNRVVLVPGRVEWDHDQVLEAAVPGLGNQSGLRRRRDLVWLGSDSVLWLSAWEQPGKSPTVAWSVCSGGPGEHPWNSTPGSAPTAQPSDLKIAVKCRVAGIQDSCERPESTLWGSCTLLEQWGPTVPSASTCSQAWHLIPA